MKIRAKKSLGQNFLIDRNVLDQIVDCVEINNKEILEIGPGSGNLTAHILKKKPKKLYVIEKDDELSLLLNEKFEEQIEIQYIASLTESEKDFQMDFGKIVARDCVSVDNSHLMIWKDVQQEQQMLEGKQ